MSGFLGKTIESINSLLSPLAPTVGLRYMYERCLSSRTKREEEFCVNDSLRILRERLSEPGVRLSTVKKCLAFVVFAEMMGYKAEFAYIHAVKLAQQGSLSEKKMGYMVCVQLLKDTHPLSMLLVNTVVRDLASRNMVTIAMALAASCHLISPDQASAILPMVVDKLTHSNEYIRGKAVIVLHHFLRLCPGQAAHYMHQVRALLGDSDPGVVALVLQYLLHLSQENPDFARDLWPAVVSVQEQILSGRLPKDYSHHGISAPWTQLTILRLLRQLHPPILDIQKVLQETLKAVSSEFNSGLAAAISIECLTTMLELSPSSSSESSPSQLTSSTMSTIGHMLSSQNTNLRYEGLGLLQVLVSRHKLSLTREQQGVILRCLQHPDNAIKLKTLRLLCAVADYNSAESISNQIIDYIRNHCTNVHLQGELVFLGMTLAEKFPSSGNHWHLAALLRLLPLTVQFATTIQARIKLALMADGEPDTEKTNTARRKVLTYLTKHSESRVAPTSILELYVWTLSQFHELLTEEDGVTPDSKSHTAALNRIVSLGQKVLQNQIQGSLEIVPTEIHTLLLEVVEAARCIVINHGESVPSLPKLLHELVSMTVTRVFADATLRTACNELLNILSFWTEACEVNQMNKEEVELDFTLSFLDELVCKDLDESGIPFKPLPVRTCSRAAIQLVLETERHQGDVDLVNSVLLAAPCSLGSSELSLAGTENANNWAGSCSSVSSADSKCWTYTSPTQDVPLTPVWTKEGRIKGEIKQAADQLPEDKNLTEDPAVSVNNKPLPAEPSITSWLQKSTDTDPLDDLQNDFSQQKTEKMTQSSETS